MWFADIADIAMNLKDIMFLHQWQYCIDLVCLTGLNTIIYITHRYLHEYSDWSAIKNDTGKMLFVDDSEIASNTGCINKNDTFIK